MAIRTWSSLGSNDMNDLANWSGAGSFATDDLVFDATSVVNAAATANIICNSITIAAAFTGTWSINGRTATMAQGFSDDGTTGAHDYGNSIICNGASATVHIGAGVGTVTASMCALVMNGTTGMVFDDDKGVNFSTFTMGAAGVVTSSGGSSTIFTNNTTPLTIVNGGTLTLNTQFILRVNGSIAAWSLTGAYTLTGTGSINVQSQSTGYTISLPALTCTGNLSILMRQRTTNHTTVWNMTGHISTQYTFQPYNSNTGCTTTFNTNNYNITCGTLAPGNGQADGTFTFNAGLSTITITGMADTNNGAGTTAINLGSSQTTCSGNWTYGTNWTVAPGTSTVTFNALATITSSAKTFYDLIINAPAATVDTAGDLTLAAGGDLTVTDGTFDISGDDVIVGSNITIAVAATLTIDANSTFTVLGAGTIATGGKTFPPTTINGNTAINASATFTRLTIGTDGITVTWQAGQTFTFSNLAAANWSGSAAALNRFVSSIPGTQYTLVIPNAVTLTYMYPSDSIAQGFVITANDGTSINGGNNINWLLPALRTGVKMRPKLAVSNGVGIGV